MVDFFDLPLKESFGISVNLHTELSTGQDSKRAVAIGHVWQKCLGNSFVDWEQKEEQILQ